MSAVVRSGHPVAVPNLFFVEVAAAVRRISGDPALARATAAKFRAALHSTHVALDDAMADRALDVALLCALRATDAVYVAVAQVSGGILVTHDKEQLERPCALIRTLGPADALALIRAEGRPSSEA